MKRAYRLIAPVALAALVSACSILPKPSLGRIPPGVGPDDQPGHASDLVAARQQTQTSEFLDSPRIAVVPMAT
jgi:cholesterol transport system auxiliary component